MFNKLNKERALYLLNKESFKRKTVSFYKYVIIEKPNELRDNLFSIWKKLEVLGRIYLAKEGINAQLSLPSNQIEAFKSHLNTISFLKGVRLNVAIEHKLKSFLKLTIKVRNKIVADGLVDDKFDVTKKGIHLNAIEFNNLLDHKNTICVDMRNHYESEIGHFKNAITPDVDTFRESLPIIEKKLSKHKENKNILMYCTGGIRCEKASAYFKHKGFKKVYQLEGGIIEYARQVKNQNLENKFIGKNFVFDERRGERISDDIISKCHQCGTPCDDHVNCKNEACHLLFIQCKSCSKKFNNCCSDQCTKIIEMPLEKQKIFRKDTHNSNKIFKKGRSKSLKFKN